MATDKSPFYAVSGPGTANGPTLPVAGQSQKAVEIDVGSVKDGKVEFANWKGDADKPSPAPPAPCAPDKRIGFAIVGLGRLALEQILPAFVSSRHARIAGLVSGSPEKARVVAAQYGISEQAIYDYDSMARLADNPDIQAVYVVTPNAMHLPHVIAAANAGKHVLCEKPMANTSDEARQMIDACAKAGVKLMVAYRCQFEVFNSAAAALVNSGDLGRPRIIEATNTQVQGSGDQWRLRSALAGGGALPDIGLYCLNGARHVLGEEPVEVYAQIINPADDDRYKEVEESIAFILRFASGAIALCASSYGAHETKDMRIRLERGWIDIENAFAYKGQRMRVARRKDDFEVVEEQRLEFKDQFMLEIDHFAQCVRDDHAPSTPGEEGLRDQVLMEAIYQSARERRPIAVDG
ncbi:oxidoreductase domain-containing protein [Caballeronia sordidicola]|uniref:Oxidoreductase domain-containing protein n=1 Tax=Caballeronia sordidicola TaxID=196367 RepID=A0A158G6R7_CABSO|nr:Gfo/Idh/MocA family oxidoreductase [Caballeronia sordidicola]SAL27785.1 oxidoreductase domain-containing protein [Caballeronia sordidicola]